MEFTRTNKLISFEQKLFLMNMYKNVQSEAQKMQVIHIGKTLSKLGLKSFLEKRLKLHEKLVTKHNVRIREQIKLTYTIRYRRWQSIFDHNFG